MLCLLPSVAPGTAHGQPKWIWKMWVETTRDAEGVNPGVRQNWGQIWTQLVMPPRNNCLQELWQPLGATPCSYGGRGICPHSEANVLRWVDPTKARDQPLPTSLGAVSCPHPQPRGDRQLPREPKAMLRPSLGTTYQRSWASI